MQHASRFLTLVQEAKGRVKETTVREVKDRLDRNETVILVDVREESEFERGRLPDAVHLGKGILERDVERIFPDLDIELVLYCGGGYRSALAAESLQKMGYTNVISMDGGYKGWMSAGYPLETD